MNSQILIFIQKSSMMYRCAMISALGLAGATAGLLGIQVSAQCCKSSPKSIENAVAMGALDDEDTSQR
jgi:hypothetical protein